MLYCPETTNKTGSWSPENRCFFNIVFRTARFVSLSLPRCRADSLHSLSLSLFFALSLCLDIVSLCRKATENGSNIYIYVYIQMGAGQNQRFATGPGPTLATYPVTKGTRQAGACRYKPATGITVLILSRATNRDKGYVTSPAFHTFVTTEGCWQGSSGTELRLMVRFICVPL